MRSVDRVALVSAALDSRIDELVAACRARRPLFATPPGAVETLVRALLGKADDPAAALAVLHLEDLYLSAACALGDPPALTEFDSRVLPGAVRAAARLDGSRDFADEVAQAVRGRLFTAEPGEKPRIAGYAGRASLESWTRAVALRIASSLRDTARVEHVAIDDKLAELATGDSAELTLIREQLREEFRESFGAALATLPSRSRAVLRLHVVEGVTLEGLATAYSVHRATVARWLASARSSLLKRTRARLASALKLEPGEIDSLIDQARSRLEISITRFLESDE